MSISSIPYRVGPYFCALIVALTLTAAAPGAASPPPALFETATGQPLSLDRLTGDLADRRFVLLGEKHDNPEHHEIQAELLRRMIALGRKPALVWEMIERGKQPMIDEFQTSGNADPDAFAEVVGWAGSGWPDWKFYRPIAEVALTVKLPMVAGNLDAATVRAISGGEDLEPELMAALRLHEPIPESVREALLGEIYRGHCGLIPRDRLAPMLAVQVARDASLAEAMVRSAAAADGAVLIAGAQHARRDIGVGFHLQQRLGVGNVSAIGLLEGDLEIVWAGEERQIPADRFDYVWYTDPAQPNKDYCAELKARFGASTKD